MKKGTLLTALAIAVTTISLASTVAMAAVGQVQIPESDPILNPVKMPTVIKGAQYDGKAWNVNPQEIINKIGWAKFKEIYLANGDVANWNFDNVDTFINLVDGKVQINGIMNSVRDGKAYAGNAIFIAKGGFAVGESGVINVGSLGVQAPNADIEIKGKVFAQNGIDLQGKDVDVKGAMINGVRELEYVRNNAQADIIFNRLVNVENRNFSNGAKFVTNPSDIKITTSNGLYTTSNSVIANGSGDVILTNNGTGGMNFNGLVLADKNIDVQSNAGKIRVDVNAGFETSKGNIKIHDNTVKPIIVCDAMADCGGPFVEPEPPMPPENNYNEFNLEEGEVAQLTYDEPKGTGLLVEPKGMGLLVEPKGTGLLDTPKYTIVPKEVKPVTIQPRNYENFKLEPIYNIEVNVKPVNTGYRQYESFKLETKDLLDK